MARTRRLEFAGACYHVINRGSSGRDLFAGKGAAADFERALGEACESFHWRIHAYVIMRNHFHLALETPEPNLSVGMKWLQGTWVARVSRLRRVQGRSFQGRFKALQVEPGLALAEVAHYIHLSPWRARAVAGKGWVNFPWSSLGKFLHPPRPAWLVGETVLRESGHLPDTARGWAKYVGFLRWRADEEPEKRDALFGPLSRGWCVGSEEFRQRMTHALRGRHPKRERFAGMKPREWRKERLAGWERALRAAARQWRIDLNALPAQKSAPAKLRLAAYLKRKQGAANAWIATRLQMGTAASMSKFVARFHAAGGFTDAEQKAVAKPRSDP